MSDLDFSVLPRTVAPFTQKGINTTLSSIDSRQAVVLADLLEQDAQAVFQRIFTLSPEQQKGLEALSVEAIGSTVAKVLRMEKSAGFDVVISGVDEGVPLGLCKPRQVDVEYEFPSPGMRGKLKISILF